MPKLKVAVLTDGEHVPRFWLLALNALENCDEVSIFACANTRLPPRRFRHGAYYALNLVTVRNPLTASVGIAEGSKRISRVVPFESDYQGIWQALPARVIEELNSGGFDVVLKVGMYLLKVPEELQVPILSFHHGDPDRYRGRPAGFYETVDKSPLMGQIVQVLSNKLDGGRVVAYGETKIIPYSYRATLIAAYSHSYLLINRAVQNALAGVALPKHSSGKNYRLPSNLRVVEFVAAMVWQYLRRLFYGAFVEKKWMVSTALMGDGTAAQIVDGGAFPPADQWRTFPVRRPYIFYADPFFSSEGDGVLVEAVNRRTGLGEILLLDGDDQKPVLVTPGHLSYPFSFEEGGRHYLLPEAASWDSTRCYDLEDGTARPAQPLRLENDARVVDPTMLCHQGRFYLFGNDAEVGSNVLFIWSADSLDSLFSLHPGCPVLVSPRGARMGGGFVEADGRLIRLGQSFLGGYGDGIFAFEVKELSATVYEEAPIGSVKFDHVKGPHTLNWRHDKITFDWYRERLSPFAALSRLMARRTAKFLQRGAAPPQPIPSGDN